MLNVRYGSFRALERAFLEELSALKKDPLAPIAVVTPSRSLADRLQRLIALEEGRSFLGISFHTFYSLALEIVSEAGGLDRIVVRQAFFFDRLLEFLLGSRSRSRGLAAAYRSSLKDLIDAGVESRALDLLEQGLLKDAMESARLRELLELLRRYENRMAELKVAPVAELTRRAAELAGSSQGLRRYRALLYYGFYDLTGLQSDFFEAVAQEHPVTVFFPYLRQHPAFSFADKFFESKLHLGGSSPKALGEGSCALGRTQEALFKPGQAGAAPKRALRIFTASGARDELWRVAKEIHRLVEEEGYSYLDIGVVARTLEPYRASVVEIFGENVILYSMSCAEPLLRKPAAKLCWTLLTLARRDFPALAVLDLVESPFFKGRSSSSWRLLVRRLRIHRGWLQWESKLHSAAEQDKGPSQTLWELLRSWRAALTWTESRSWSFWAEHAIDFLKQHLQGGEDSGFQEFIDQVQGLKVLDLLGQHLTFQDFLDSVQEILTRATGSAQPAKLGVRVLDAMEARGESFKVLFIVGLNQGLFPRTIREDPLLRDSARQALQEVGGYWIGRKQAGFDEEKLLFYLLTASAQERLYCCYTRSDEQGRAQVPSIYLIELCRAAGIALGAPALTEHVPRQPQLKLTRPHLQKFLTPKELSIAAAFSGADARPLYKAMAWDAEGFHKQCRRVQELNRYGAPGPLDGVIGEPRPYLTKLRRGGFSPSALESLARCPFQFFASRLLGLGEIEEPSERGEIAAHLKGKIYHKALAAFHDRLLQIGYWDQSEAPFPESEFKACLDQVFQVHTWRELGMYPLLWELTCDIMRRHMRTFLEWDLQEIRASGLRPRWLEAPIEAELPIRLPGVKKLRFKGVPDRLDVGGGHFRIVDYKSRWRRGKLESLVLKGRLFQPSLYLELASRQRRLRRLKPLGVRFYALEDYSEDSGKPKIQEYNALSHAKNRELVFSALSQLVESLRQGRFLIHPDDSMYGHCRWCSFGGVCRKNHPPTAWRAQASDGD